jgi:hypothetical protein
MRQQGIDDTDKADIRQASEHAGMIAAHDARPDNPEAQFPFRRRLDV